MLGFHVSIAIFPGIATWIHCQYFVAKLPSHNQEWNQRMLTLPWREKKQCGEKACLLGPKESRRVVGSLLSHRVRVDGGANLDNLWKNFQCGSHSSFGWPVTSQNLSIHNWTLQIQWMHWWPEEGGQTPLSNSSGENVPLGERLNIKWTCSNKFGSRDILKISQKNLAVSWKWSGNIWGFSTAHFCPKNLPPSCCSSPPVFIWAKYQDPRDDALHRNQIFLELKSMYFPQINYFSGSNAQEFSFQKKLWLWTVSRLDNVKNCSTKSWRKIGIFSPRCSGFRLDCFDDNFLFVEG